MNPSHPAAQPEDPAGSNEALEVVLSHARLQWDAEVENARRLSTRATSLVTLLVALLGLGLVRMGAPGSLALRGLEWIEQLLLIGSLGAFMAALAVLLAVRNMRVRVGNGWPLASCLLRWPIERGVDPFRVTSRQSRRIVLRSLLDAIADLRDRNARRKEEIDRAQVWLLVSGALAAVSLVTYQLAG
jgi:hypothetical protein